MAIMLVLIAIAFTYQKPRSGNSNLVANTAFSNEEVVEIDPAIAALDKKTQVEFQNLNETEKFARNLISNIVASQPANQNLDETTVNALVNKAVNEVPTKIFSATTQIDDLNFIIVVDKNTAIKELKAYVNSYYSNTQSLRILAALNLSTIDSYFVDRKDPIKDLTTLNTAYKGVINKMINVPLPAEKSSRGAGYHLSIINSAEKIMNINNDIMANINDGISVFSDLMALTQVLGDLDSSVTKMDSALGIKRQ